MHGVDVGWAAFISKAMLSALHERSKSDGAEADNAPESLKLLHKSLLFSPPHTRATLKLLTRIGVPQVTASTVSMVLELLTCHGTANREVTFKLMQNLAPEQMTATQLVVTVAVASHQAFHLLRSIEADVP